LEEKFKLIPIYSINGIMRAWPFVADGLEAVLRNAGTDTNLDKIYNDLLAGNLLLWLAFLNGQYIGFATTSIVSVPTLPKHLWIVHTYKKLKVPSEWLLKGLERLEEYAKEMGCLDIRFYAKLKPWQAKLEKLGYAPSYTEYIKEVKHEDS